MRQSHLFKFPTFQKIKKKTNKLKNSLDDIYINIATF